MTQPPSFKRRALWISFLGGVPLFVGLAHAQETPALTTPATIVVVPPASTANTATAATAATAATGNDDALKAWKAASNDQAVPVVVKTDDGALKFEWHGTFATDVYNNDIKPPPAHDAATPLATPLNTGSFAKAIFTSDLRVLEPGGQVNFMQFGVTASTDRSQLSRYRNQLNSLQLGRTGTGYQYGAGDAAVSFSQLGSTLGLRGLNVVQQIGKWSLATYGGVVSDSWEALYNRTPLDSSAARSRFTRNVLGTKVEYALATGLKVFTTMQGYSDSVASLDADKVTQQPSAARALTTGLAYQEGAWAVTFEIAASRFKERYQLERSGDALLLDTTYRQSVWSVRGGYHNVAPKFVSLSQSASPGIKEWYTGADWTAATWLTLGTDYRDAANRTAALELLPPPVLAGEVAVPISAQAATSSNTNALSNRANLNFNALMQGLSLNLANSNNRGEDAQKNKNKNKNNNAALAYSSATWNGNVGYTVGKTASSSSPQADSTSRGLQAQLGRNYTGTVIPWSLGWSVTAGDQLQKLLVAGTQTKSRTHGFTLNGQRSDWAQVTLNYQGASVTQTTGGPTLATRSLQLDIVRQFNQLSSLKAYLRLSSRNIGDVTLRTEERNFGLLLNFGW